LTAALALPARGNGRPTQAKDEKYQAEVDDFCAEILKIQSSLDFAVSSRGWCYLLEEHGLGKGDFDKAQDLINKCRKDGRLPLDICAEDEARQAIHTEFAWGHENEETVEEAIERELEDIESARDDAIESAGSGYAPHGFWFGLDCYVEMLVEKIDLKELFAPICLEYCIPLGNSRGWPCINSRAAMMRRFQAMEQQGKRCVLLYCGDHDPAGLNISDSFRDMFLDLAGAVGWQPDNLVIDRFGLNADFIEQHNLTWIDGLVTSSGENLANPKHLHHDRDYVQSYLAKYGARKVEANALVVRADAARDLCRTAINKYVPATAPHNHTVAIINARNEIRRSVMVRLEDE